MHFSARRRHIAETNIRLCFPELTPRARARLVRDHFASLGISMLEVAMGWWASERRLRTLGQVQGLEHLQQALAHGKGVILLSAHFTCLELGGRLLALHAPFHVMYRPHENPVLEHVQRSNREAHFERAIPRDDPRAMLRSLKQNKAVWYAPDQNYGHKHSVFAPFFGVPAATSTATARLARVSGAAVVPFFPIRRGDGRGYDLTLLPALEDFPSDDVAADTARINRLIEDHVRKAPEQYLWAHQRFKDRPAGSPALYARRTSHANR
jgi:KDO2-lipid IV(A) lauroyltransferase